MGFDDDLSEEEINELDGYLSGVPDGRIGSVHAMDGLITAIVCTPEPRPSADEYLSLLQENIHGALMLRDADEARRIVELVTRHYEAVLRSLRDWGKMIDGELVYYAPLFDEDEGGNIFAESWFAGFVAGARLRPDVWGWRFESSDDWDENPLEPLVQFATQPRPGPDGNPVDEPWSVEEQKVLAVHAMFGILDIYQENHNVKPATGQAYNPMYSEFDTYVRDTPKVGRNDPCPCGSGRKYKKCCARLERVQ